MIVRPKSVLEDGLKPSMLESCIGQFLADAEKRRTLRAYYDGSHAISNRSRASGMPNNRLSHAFPRYICTVAAGYLAGNPVAYETDERNQAALDAVLDCYGRCSVDSVDAELARMASLYGRSVELVFADAQSRPRVAAIDPETSFVVYDDTVECRPLFGIRMLPRLRADGAEDGWTTEVYTDSEVIVHAPRGFGAVGPVQERRAHFFGAVPMVEVWNGEDERGDFEGVMTLIDAYDRLQSDRVNDKEQFVDALLLLSGCTMENDERGRTPGQQLREDKVLVLPDGDAKAEWLCKDLNESDAEVLKKALDADIHKLSMVPDLSDEHFAGNVSGVAMKYKMLGLEQLTRVKERWFREALRSRLELFGAFLALRGEPELDVNAVRMIFIRALPSEESER